jgi:hypothetical protein
MVIVEFANFASSSTTGQSIQTRQGSSLRSSARSACAYNRAQASGGLRASATDVESWLTARMAAPDTAHLINIPSNPPGWSAGKWGEWYPDLLDANGKLSIAAPKPYWQSGWLRQHDRLMSAISAMQGRIPLVVSGDLHAIAEGRMLRTGTRDLSRNPVVTVLSGPLGSGDLVWPSAFRGIGAMPSVHLEMQEDLKPLEENGFMLADLTPDRVVLRYCRWNAHRDSIESIDSLEPFRTTELKLPG